MVLDYRLQYFQTCYRQFLTCFDYFPSANVKSFLMWPILHIKKYNKQQLSEVFSYHEFYGYGFKKGF